MMFMKMVTFTDGLLHSLLSLCFGLFKRLIDWILLHIGSFILCLCRLWWWPSLYTPNCCINLWYHGIHFSSHVVSVFWEVLLYVFYISMQLIYLIESRIVTDFVLQHLIILTFSSYSWNCSRILEPLPQSIIHLSLVLFSCKFITEQIFYYFSLHLNVSLQLRSFLLWKGGMLHIFYLNL